MLVLLQLLAQLAPFALQIRSLMLEIYLLLMMHTLMSPASIWSIDCGSTQKLTQRSCVRKCVVKSKYIFSITLTCWFPQVIIFTESSSISTVAIVSMTVSSVSRCCRSPTSYSVNYCIYSCIGYCNTSLPTFLLLLETHKYTEANTCSTLAAVSAGL